MSSSAAISVVIVEDHPLFRQGLRQVIEEAPGLQVVGEAASAREALEVLGRETPRVMLVDLRLPDRSGLELVEEVRDKYPEISYLFLSAYDYPHYVKAAVEAGAAGYLLKDEPAHRIVEAIQAAAQGQSAALSGALQRRLQELMPEALTPREGEIVALLASGRSLQKIAESLRISPRTVRNHLNNIYSKLDLHSQTELVAWAWRTGSMGSRLP